MSVPTRTPRGFVRALAIILLLVAPWSMGVLGQAGGVSAAFADDHVDSVDNAPVTGVMTIQNDGTSAENVTVSAGYITPGWHAHVPTHIVELPAGGAVEETYVFSPPANASPGSQGQLSVRVTRTTGQMVTAYLFVMTTESSTDPDPDPDPPTNETPTNQTPLNETPLVPGHPRLLVRESDLPRLRAWATSTNPVYQDGLRVIAQSYKNNMDAGKVPALDNGGITWTLYPTEVYAEVFAFMSLIETNSSVRADYAQRAHDLIMHVIDQAALGPGEGKYRHERFATYDRMNWWGESYGLTVDWVYQTFTDDELAKIRQVFLRWESEIQSEGRNALVGGHAWSGIPNDPALLQDPHSLRWSMNNYFMVQTRNMAFYALAFDEADDPNGTLHAYLGEALHARLFMIDHTLRHDLRGGLSPEGWGYGPLGLGRWANLLLALHTAGEDDPAKWGPQVKIAGNPFWPEMVPAFLHSIPPQPRMLPGESWRGPVYTPALFGDLSDDWVHDPIDLIAPLGIYAHLSGDASTHDATRWIETHVAPGGASKLTYRVAGPVDDAFNSIQLFLLFDPTLPSPTDPRPALPRDHFAPGVGQLVSRSAWAQDASMFVLHADPTVIDHQLPEDGSFAFYRHGEWLTKGRSGYDGATSPQCGIARSDNHNTLAIQNDPLPPNNWLSICAAQGSQMMYSPHVQADIMRHVEFGDGYAYAGANLTVLYNYHSYSTVADDVLAATRSAVFIEPDHVVLYDRALSATDGRFKRFFMNFATEPQIVGNVASATMPSGQRVFATTLLPAAPTLSAALPPANEKGAAHETMTWKLRVEDASNPKESRFLHVVQGADAGSSADPVSRIVPTEGDFEGVVVAGRAILFAADPERPSDTLRYPAPAGLAAHLVTGLVPNATYAPEVVSGPLGIVVSLERVEGVAVVGLKASPNGTLAFDAANLPVNAAPITTVSVTGPQGAAGWWTGAVTVTLAASDADGPGVAATYVVVDGGAPALYTGPFTLSSEGTHTLVAWSVDLAGAQESPQAATVVRIDPTPPTVALEEPMAGNAYVFGHAIAGPASTNKTIVVGGIEIRAAANDATSGLVRVEILVDGIERANATQAPLAWHWDTSSEAPGEHEILVRATDEAGNVATTAPFRVSVVAAPRWSLALARAPAPPGA